MDDLISRQAIDKFIDGLEEIFADIRERHIDDSVCGLCEYDGAYIGQSGDWCNECPGFDKDDCFKLSDKTRKKWTEEIIKALTPIQPANNSEIPNSSDAISRQAAIDLLKQMRKDGDMIPWEGKDVFARIRKLPPAQPDIIRCRNCKFASGDSRICMKFGHSPIGELDFCAWAERRTDEA